MPGKALFIGHSLVGPVLPSMFNTFMSDQGLAMRADAQVINGAPLRYNWDNGTSAEGVNARAVLPSGDYDVVVVTEAIPLDDQIRWNDTEGYAKRYFDLALSGNADTQFYIYETWHEIGADTQAWRAQIASDLSKWEGIADHINASAPQGAADALIVPAGQAMAALHDAIAQGAVPGLSSIRDVFDDNIHLNDTGLWFIAALHAEVVAGADAAALPLETLTPWGTPYGGPDAAMAAAMNVVIDQTLASYDRDGVGTGGNMAPLDPVITPTTSPVPEPEITVPDPLPSDPTGGVRSGDLALGFGLSHIADYAPASPFLDVFKTARPFFGHEPGRWGGADNAALKAQGVLDSNGWPTEIPAGLEKIGTVLLTEFPAEMTDAAGRYRVTWEGSGTVEIGFGAGDIVYGSNEAWFSYAPDGTTMVTVDILSTDPSGTGDYIRDLSIVHARHVDAFDAGAMFNPKWLDIIDGAESLRFMDWMDTNNSAISAPQDAPETGDATWADTGVPLDVMVRLANETETDPWFTLPHLATDGYIRAFVQTVRDTLDAGLTPYFEFSNEVWNWQFAQAQASEAEGQVRFAGVGTAWVQNYAANAVNMAQIIDQVYGANSSDVVKVLATHTGWRGLEDAILNAPNWVAEDPGNRTAPSTHFDAYAITGYFDGGLGRDGKAEMVLGWLGQSLSRAQAEAASRGLTGQTAADYAEARKYDYATDLAFRELRDGSVSGDQDGSLAELAQTFAYHKAQADAAGLDLVIYEGGTHIVGVGQWQSNAALTDFFTHLNYTAEMGEIYDLLLQSWQDAGGALFNAFTAVDRPSQYGSWGHLRHLDDSNPRMTALQDFFGVEETPPQAQGSDPVTVPMPTIVVDGEHTTGDDNDDLLIGGSANDLMRGGSGDDRLTGGGANDFIDGGAGWDSAVYAGRQENFTLSITADGIEITDRSGTEGTDQLVNIEALRFRDPKRDGTEIEVNLDQLSGAARLSTSELRDIIELYVAYFDRAPAAEGLSYWATRFDAEMTLPEIAESFFVQPETQRTYDTFLNDDGTLSNTAGFVNAVFNNVLGRNPDSNYWMNELDNNPAITPAIFILAVLNGAKAASGGPADAAFLDAKTDIGMYFSATKGLSGYDNTVSVMEGFDGTAGSVASAVAEIDLLYARAHNENSPVFLIELTGVMPDFG